MVGVERERERERERESTSRPLDVSEQPAIIARASAVCSASQVATRECCCRCCAVVVASLADRTDRRVPFCCATRLASPRAASVGVSRTE